MIRRFRVTLPRVSVKLRAPHWRSLLLALLLMVLGTGCASVLVQPAQRARLKRVGVVSAMGDEMNFHLFTVMNVVDQQFTAKTPLRYDAFIEHVAETVLRGDGIRPVPLPNERAIARKAVKTGPWEKIYAPFDVELIKGDLDRIVRTNSLEAVVIVHPLRGLAFSDQYTWGYGLFALSSLGGTQPIPHFFYGVTLYDPSAPKPVVRIQGRASGEPGMPPLSLEGMSWKKSFPEYSPIEQARIFQSTLLLPALDLPFTMRRMGLLIADPKKPVQPARKTPPKPPAPGRKRPAISGESGIAATSLPAVNSWSGAVTMAIAAKTENAP